MAEKEFQEAILKLYDNSELSWAEYKERLAELINQFKKEIAFEWYKRGAGHEARELYNPLNPEELFEKYFYPNQNKE